MRSMSLALFVHQQLKTKGKRSRQIDNRLVSPISTSSEHIQTRSKKGVIKSNPKYCD